MNIDYKPLEKPLSDDFSKLVLEFLNQSNDPDEQKILGLMAREIWNISYFPQSDQLKEIDSFLQEQGIKGKKKVNYKQMMIEGIERKKKATQAYEPEELWTRVEQFKVWKVKENYQINFDLDFYV